MKGFVFNSLVFIITFLHLCFSKGMCAALMVSYVVAFFAGIQAGFWFFIGSLGYVLAEHAMNFHKGLSLAKKDLLEQREKEFLSWAKKQIKKRGRREWKKEK